MASVTVFSVAGAVVFVGAAVASAVAVAVGAAVASAPEFAAFSLLPLPQADKNKVIAIHPINASFMLPDLLLFENIKYPSCIYKH
jgi:hypothetical protein